MRLYPAVPMLARQAVQETELPNGLILPKCSQINIHVFDIHRNPKYWDEPEEFRPERFLPDNCQKRHTYAYIPFSAGQRNCLGKENLTEMNTLHIISLCYWPGQKYAMQEMKTLLVVILKKFKILPVIDPKSIVFQTGITLRTQNEIKVKFVKRKVSS